MVIKRILGSRKKDRSCLRCGRQIERVLHDDVVYTCDGCGQKHFVDNYKDRIVLTVVEHPEIRRRPVTEIMTEQSKARRKLIAKVNAGRMEANAWEETYRDWLSELAELPEEEIEQELKIMDGEMLRRVQKYLENRSKE